METVNETLTIEKYTDFRFFLQDVFVDRCQRNSAYSIRSFAKNLNMDHSYLNRILKGKKEVSDKLIIRLGKELGFSLKELKPFLSSQSPKGKLGKSLDKFKKISEEVFVSISKWYYDGILELTKLKGFVPSSIWISKTLGIPQSEVNIATQRLQDLNLLEIKDSGEWVDQSEFNTIITDEFTSNAQKRLQRELLKKAADALDTFPKEVRSQSSLMMAIDRRKFKQANEIIKNFRREMSELLESSDEEKNDVYQLVVSFYPLTNLVEEDSTEVIQ